MTDLFLIFTLAGSVGMLPFIGTFEECQQRAAFEQARSAELDRGFVVKREHRGPEHMIWKLHPELPRR